MGTVGAPVFATVVEWLGQAPEQGWWSVAAAIARHTISRTARVPHNVQIAHLRGAIPMGTLARITSSGNFAPALEELDQGGIQCGAPLQIMLQEDIQDSRLAAPAEGVPRCTSRCQLKVARIRLTWTVM